jgi:hypothetical protein
MKSKPILISCLLLSALQPTSGYAQVGPAARTAVEIVEQLAKRGGTTAARELAEMGGEVAVREVLEQAQREGGEQLVKTLSEQAGKYGIIAVQAAKGSPKVVIEAVEKLPKDLAEQGLRAISHEPVAMQKLISETGQEALEAAARHPGVGSQIAKTLGKEGAETAAKLGDDAALALARNADAIAALPAAERTSLLAALRTSTAKVMAFLEKHPKALLTAAAVTAFIAGKDEILGINGQPGTLERLIKEPLRLTGMVVAALIGLWGLIKLSFAYRSMRKKSSV